MNRNLKFENSSCVIGYGVVGKATSFLFKIKKHYDINPIKSNIVFDDILNCKYVFICMPTLVNATGFDTSSIVSTITKLEKKGFRGLYIIRSTVNPGFAKKLMVKLKINRIISNPEFLSEDTWKKDTTQPDMVLLGGERNYINKFKNIYKSYLNPDIKQINYILTDNTTAETSKLALNSFFATKVIFANQIYDYCQKNKSDYETIKLVMESHQYGPKNHFKIYFKGKRGVNGHCLPKDTKALFIYSKLPLLKKIIEINDSIIKLNTS